MCSNDPEDAALTANDADPPAECATASCSAGEYFNIDWDGDESGCLDSYEECCWPCEDNTFQAVDSTQATFCEQCAALAPPSPHQFNPACRLACFLPLAWRPPEHVSLQWRKPTCLTV